MTSEQCAQCVILMRKFIWCGWDNRFLKMPYDLTQAVINQYYEDCPTLSAALIEKMISMSKREQERKVWIECIRDLIEFVAKAVYIGGITKNKRQTTNTHYVVISYKGRVLVNDVQRQFCSIYY